MEAAELATRGLTMGRHGNHEVDNMVLMSSKPLHRFVQREPKALGIVIVVFGCAELLMGFHLAGESTKTSNGLYIPFWQGALFLLCGNLSIYTEGHPSKKMVTVCLAMYVVSLLGIIVSLGYRIFCFNYLTRLHQMATWRNDNWAIYQADQLFGIEGVLFTSSLCVLVLLIFLSSVARLALKSTNTQVIVQCIVPPAQQSDTTSN
ncbi:uncharacterized protein LOC113160532 [Anabas testudineus]|uniref:Uncharacterized protein n=1 Tax=Anabas testudineus TaxID=64144 RepID=A0A7N6ATE6_ANATE|nr:uncharacterized protein LOC113160532 [Anabas testudineus]